MHEKIPFGLCARSLNQIEKNIREEEENRPILSGFQQTREESGKA